ncbi:uncharacterized protein LOC131877713 isoform X2 [Tigriopus californicus]|uniref:uncharacterized protein LOC131877713 isoform X2 n=1 Tax=Tigriopus californicus TaxID=6832 RepID=UPI0027D9DFF4|nr:uncharacterized protein LOC131877713 isoform X2 [Tigriopus californicus]
MVRICSTTSLLVLAFLCFTSRPSTGHALPSSLKQNSPYYTTLYNQRSSSSGESERPLDVASPASIRIKREGFFDFGSLPNMMRGFAHSVGKGLTNMMHSAGRMVNHVMYGGQYRPISTRPIGHQGPYQVVESPGSPHHPPAPSPAQPTVHIAHTPEPIQPAAGIEGYGSPSAGPIQPAFKPVVQPPYEPSYQPTFEPQPTPFKPSPITHHQFKPISPKPVTFKPRPFNPPVSVSKPHKPSNGFASSSFGPSVPASNSYKPAPQSGNGFSSSSFPSTSFSSSSSHGSSFNNQGSSSGSSFGHGSSQGGQSSFGSQVSHGGSSSTSSFHGGTLGGVQTSSFGATSSSSPSSQGSSFGGQSVFSHSNLAPAGQSNPFLGSQSSSPGHGHGSSATQNHGHNPALDKPHHDPALSTDIAHVLRIAMKTLFYGDLDAFKHKPPKDDGRPKNKNKHGTSNFVRFLRF